MILSSSISKAAPPSKQEAQKALNKAITFFHQEVSTNGGYLYAYSEDLSLRQGENPATKHQIWVEPPGTPAVGEALLIAFQKTKEPVALTAAKDAAYALLAGQLRSGGWASLIDFEKPFKYQYRKSEVTRGRNSTTFDDNKSQSALRFLMLLDQELDFKEKQIHEAVLFAQESFLQAQFPNGAWPQQYTEFPDPEQFPVQKARYPKVWSKTFPRKRYTLYYTFNDNTIADMIDVMLLAHQIYKDDRFLLAAKKAGDFILLAQMPEPQPAWAQQYNAEMVPSWARKFEPPAITGGESQGIIRVLLELYLQTGEKKYLEPIPRAIAYLKKSELPGGKLARFYELKTNTPLFFTRDYELTYSSDNVPTHYAFLLSSNLNSLENLYRKLLKASPEKLEEMRNPARRVRLTPSLQAKTKSAIDSLDHRGAWVKQGKIRIGRSEYQSCRVIESRTFMERIKTLSDFISVSNE